MDKVQEYKEYIENHFLESKASALNIAKEIIGSELNAGGQAYTRTLHIPKIFNQQDKKNFEKIIDTTYSIFSKTIEAYRNDTKVQALFPFDERLKELIMLPVSYTIPIPICRMDIFYNEETKDFHFCEFNTDGTSAMNENQRLDHFLQFNNVFQADNNHYEHTQLVSNWTHAFLKTVHSIKGMKEYPNIGIVDFLESAYLSELYVYEKEFRNQGYNCEVIDIRDLEYDGQVLKSKKTGMEIDVIYRRAVTSDVMKHYDEIAPFIEAVKDGNVELIGHFQTQIVHHKEISKALLNPILQKYFTKEEKDFLSHHIPTTYDLTSQIKVDWIDKDQWIIKPKDSFASKGVWAGVDCTLEQWEKHIQEAMDTDYIIQRYITPYKTENIDLVNSDEFDLYSNMTGLYVFNGQLAGIYSRMSDGGIISTQYNEKTVATLFMNE